jgi:hypothetical protein
MSRSIFIVLTVFLFGCETTNEKLFWVSKPSGQENDFLFLVESTNVEPLQADSLRLFLTQSEFDNIGHRRTTYRNFGQVHKQDNFAVFVLLQEIDTLVRNYNFFLRTYDNNFKVIDSFVLATWDEDQEKFCYGSIDRSLMVERKCDGEKPSDIMQIGNDGRIKVTSDHKP